MRRRGGFWFRGIEQCQGALKIYNSLSCSVLSVGWSGASQRTEGEDCIPRYASLSLKPLRA